MNRQEWYAHHRDTRLKRQQTREGTALTCNTLMRLFRAVYSYDFTPHQRVFIRLVDKYEDKLSRSSLLQKKRLIHSWRPEARRRSLAAMEALVYSSNFLMTLIKKDPWEGGYLPVPTITYGKEET